MTGTRENARRMRKNRRESFTPLSYQIAVRDYISWEDLPPMEMTPWAASV
jgi:hypothetical protein